MLPIQNILVPVDLEEGTERALSLAVDLAERIGGRITLVHVFDVPLSYTSMGLPPTELLAPQLNAAREQLDRMLAGVRARVPAAELVVTQGIPWRELLAVIERDRPDLVVMSTHGRRGLARALLGSVAEKVVRTSPVPVLIVPAGDEG